MGTIDHHGHRLHVDVHSCGQMGQVRVESIVRIANAADIRTGRPVEHGIQCGLDRILGGVGEFVPTSGEELDPVVGHGIMRGRDHHAEGGVVEVRQIRDSRGGNDADSQRVDTRRGQPGTDGGFEHLPRRPRIPAHDRYGAARGRRYGAAGPGPILRQDTCRCLRQRQRQLGCQVGICQTTYAIGTEQVPH